MEPEQYHIHANEGGDERGNRIAWLNISSPAYAVVLEIRPDEMDKLPKVGDANWDERTSDESWSIVFQLPAILLDKIMGELEGVRAYLLGGPQGPPT